MAAPVRGTKPARRPPFFWITGALTALLLLLYGWGALAVTAAAGRVKTFGFEPGYEDGQWRVREVGPRPSALRAGDRIRAVNGDPRVRSWGFRLLMRWVPPGSPYTLTVQRGATAQDVVLLTGLRRDVQATVRGLSVGLVGLAFVILGAWVGMLRPGDAMVRVATLACLGSGLSLLRQPVFTTVDLVPSVRWLVAATFFTDPLHLAAGYDFFRRFPRGGSPGRPWSVLGGILYGGTAVACVYLNTIGVLVFMRADEGALRFLDAHAAWWDFARPLGALAFGLALFSVCGVVLRNYRLTRDADQRQRILWVAAGVMAGLFPQGLFEAVASFLPSRPGGLTASPTLAAAQDLAVVAGIFIPITISYAIVKHRVMDIPVALRLGVRYLLARQILATLAAAPLVALGVVVAWNRERPLNEVVLGHPGWLVIAATGLMTLRFRRPIQAALDRRFFREAYDSEQLLMDLVEEIKTLESTEEVSRRVAACLEAALHPRCLFVCHRDTSGATSLGSLSGTADSEAETLPGPAALLDRLPEEVGAEPFDLSRVADEDRPWLEAMGVHLIVPTTSADGSRYGLLLIGERRSEQPYSQTDRRLLKAVATQVGLWRDAAALRARVSRDRQTQQDVLLRLGDGGHRLLRECPACLRCYDGGSERCPEDGTELLLSLPVERTVDGRYRLDRLLGRGGMGAVYAATDERLHRAVAVKLMTGARLADGTARRRFEREARASARLSHPNIVVVHDVGPIGAESAYLVMELLFGSTLREELRRRGPIAPPTVAVWLDQILEGLEAAHAAGVVHRDLKPENLLLCRTAGGEPLVKILDFGLAKLREPGAGSGSLTAPGHVVGTLSYMSPEQLGGDEVDERSDIFSLAVVVVECLTARRPFEGSGTADVATAILTRPFRLPGDSPGIRRLDAVLARCLAKRPADRFASVAAMHAEIVAAVRECPPQVGRDSGLGLARG